MNIVFYIFLSLTAIYTIFNIVDCVTWYWNVILIVPNKIWGLVKSIFKK